MAQTHALDLEASSSQYASITDASQTGLDLSGDNTISFWVKAESLPTSGNLVGLITKDGVGSTSNRSYAVDLHNDAGTQEIRMYMSQAADGLTYTEISFAYELQIGMWMYVAITTDISVPASSRCELFINGSSQGNGSSVEGLGGASSIFNGNAPFVIGRYDGGTSYFDGQIKDVRVFNDVRTPSEIRSDAHTENVSDANLQGEWNLNNDYTDSSGNGNTLTPSGSPTFSTNVPWEKPTGVSGSTYLDTNLYSYYALEDATDSHSTRDLTNTGSTPFNTGHIDNAAEFNRTNNRRLAHSSNMGFDSGAPYSFSFWTKLDSFAHAYLLDIVSSLTLMRRLIIYSDFNNSTLYLFASGASVESEVLNTTDYHHVVATYDGSNTLELFINGKSQGTTVMGTVDYNFNLFSIGAAFDGFAVNLDGKIDELAIYTRQLHYGDILDLYNAGSGIPYSAPATTFSPHMIIF